MKKCVVALVLLVSCFAQARPLEKKDILFTGSVFMYESETGESGATTKNNTTIYDFKLGYMVSREFMVGALYTMKTLTSTDTNKGTMMGATVGYYAQNGAFGNLSYIIQAELGDFTKGTGYQVDAGYLGSAGGRLHLGAQLSYRTLSYAENSSDSSLGEYKTTEMFPMFIVGFRF